MRQVYEKDAGSERQERRRKEGIQKLSSRKGMNKIRKTPDGLDFPIVLSEEFIIVDDDNSCAAPIMADKDILEFVQSSKNIIDTDSENEMNNAVSVPMSPK
ncbi:hypothetical protein TNCV_488181 [Trichonephila clavipes]|nr:hypothetical protein TNCV_488181 [Trichonephila clavipes]